jgi:hypothetical protein
VEAAKGVSAYLFEGAGRSVAVLSPRPGHAAYTPPRGEGVEALDLWGNPLPQGQPVGEQLVYLSAPGPAQTLSQILDKGE